MISIPSGKKKAKINRFNAQTMFDGNDEGYVDGYLIDENQEVNAVFVRCRDGIMGTVSLNDIQAIE